MCCPERLPNPDEVASGIRLRPRERFAAGPTTTCDAGTAWIASLGYQVADAQWRYQDQQGAQSWLLVDLALPAALLEAGIEHWPLLPESLSDRRQARLRWSQRLHDLYQRGRCSDRTAQSN